MSATLPREAPRDDAQDDVPLILASREGDHDAFRRLYERYAPAVLGFLVHRLRDHALAEDALQEAFCKAYRALDTFDTKRRFGPWLSTIAENVAIDAHRRRSKLAKGLEGELASEGDQLRVVAARESEEIVRAALKVLPEGPREILLLRYRHGVTQADVAARLGVSTRTVQTREAAALELLVSMLDARRKDER